VLINAGTAAVWQPAPGERFQIILSRVLDLKAGQDIVPDTADIFDIDLFQTPKTTIDVLRSKGKKVICYFSAGGSETWRPDDYLFNETDRGDAMQEWRGEKWLDIRSANVWEVMKKRIQLASEKGCDAIDPDNVGMACAPFSQPSHPYNLKVRMLTQGIKRRLQPRLRPRRRIQPQDNRRRRDKIHQEARCRSKNVQHVDGSKKLRRDSRIGPAGHQLRGQRRVRLDLEFRGLHRVRQTHPRGQTRLPHRVREPPRPR